MKGYSDCVAVAQNLADRQRIFRTREQCHRQVCWDRRPCESRLQHTSTYILSVRIFLYSPFYLQIHLYCISSTDKVVIITYAQAQLQLHAVNAFAQKTDKFKPISVYSKHEFHCFYFHSHVASSICNQCELNTMKLHWKYATNYNGKENELNNSLNRLNWQFLVSLFRIDFQFYLFQKLQSKSSRLEIKWLIKWLHFVREAVMRFSWVKRERSQEMLPRFFYFDL